MPAHPEHGLGIWGLKAPPLLSPGHVFVLPALLYYAVPDVLSAAWAGLLLPPLLFSLSGKPDLCRCGETVREKNNPGTAAAVVAVAAG